MNTSNTVGVDMGDKNHRVVTVDSSGEVTDRRWVSNTAPALRKHFKSLAPCRVALEAGTHSGWVSRLLEEMGHEVLVGNPRRLRVIWDSDRKDDDRDAETLARITALAFILTLERADRFKKSRDVGSYVGLTPKRDQSGQSDKQLGITKAGNAELRRLLVGCAQYILGYYAKDCDLRRVGLKLAARGGKNAKRRAVVAVARKLAVLMHHLWATGETYDPFFQRNAKQKKVA